MRSLVESLPVSLRWWFLCLIGLGTLVFLVILTVQGRPLRTTAAPSGIMSFELAWSEARTAAILSSWEDVARVARRQILFDFPFLALYPLFLSLSCAMISLARGGNSATLGAILASLLLLAAPLDATENVVLLKMLAHGASTSAARIATVCASLKFVLAGAALCYTCGHGIALMWSRIHAT